MGFSQRSTARRLGSQAALSVSGARFGTTRLRGKVPSLPTALDPAQRCLVGGKPVAPNSATATANIYFQPSSRRCNPQIFKEAVFSIASRGGPAYGGHHQMTDDEAASKEILVFFTTAEQDEQKKKRGQERLLTEELARRLRAVGFSCEVRDIKTH